MSIKYMAVLAKVDRVENPRGHEKPQAANFRQLAETSEAAGLIFSSKQHRKYKHLFNWFECSRVCCRCPSRTTGNYSDRRFIKNIIGSFHNLNTLFLYISVRSDNEFNLNRTT